MKNSMFRCAPGACFRFSLVWLVAASARVQAEELAPAAVEQSLLERVKFLSSDELEGRGVSTEGIRKAAQFLKDEFARMGLDVSRVDGDAFQKLEVPGAVELGEGNSLTLTGPNGESMGVELGRDATVGAFGFSGEFDGELVFCGYSIDSTDPAYSDFADVDVKGKVVIAFRRNPQQGAEKGAFKVEHGASRHADLRSKITTAMQKGAVAFLLVNDPHSLRQAAETRRVELEKRRDEALRALDVWLDATDETRGTLSEQLAEAGRKVRGATKGKDDDEPLAFGYAAANEGRGVPSFHVRQRVIEPLLKSAGLPTLVELEAQIDGDLKPRSRVLTGWKAVGKTNVIRRKYEVANVIGVLEGEGPLAEQTIVVGAHYDHIGRGGGASLAPGSTDIHNGADDNASGTAALLELVRRFGQSGVKPPRRLVFMGFTAEEMGLLGSAHYVKKPVFPLESTVAMFNLDMVGRLQNEKLLVYGTGTSSRWTPLVKQVAEPYKFDLVFKPEGFGPSDHSSFYGKKIPVLHFFTGLHPDYHRPSDDWDKINAEGMRRVIDLTELLIRDTLRNPERPDYVEVKQPPSPARGGNRPYVGTIPEFGSDLPGYSISGVAPGSPAETAGMKGGDRIVKVGADVVTALDDFDLALRKYKAGDMVDFVVVRDDKEQTFKVTLGAPK